MALSLPFFISGQAKFMDKERTERIKTVRISFFSPFGYARIIVQFSFDLVIVYFSTLYCLLLFLCS